MSVGFDLIFQRRNGTSDSQVSPSSTSFSSILISICSHVIRAVYGFSYETMEVTGPQMVLTMKLTTFAWNVWDGRRKSEVYVFLVFLSAYCLPSQYAGLGQMAIRKENYDIPLPS
jgi:hypothetical protein